MAETNVILRGSKGLSLVKGDKPYSEINSLSQRNDVRCIDVSIDGKYLAFADNSGIKVVTLPDCQTIFEKNENMNYVKLSPKGTILSTWHPSNQNNVNNLHLYDIATQSLSSALPQKKPSRWCPHWTNDESICVRHVNMELNIYENNRFERYVHRMCSQKVANYSVVTDSQTGCHYIACYTVGAKGQPSFVRIYQYPRFEGMAIANKSFYKADYVDFKWNQKGNALLLLCSTEVDQTGKSYYGQQTLHYLNIKGETFIVSLNKDGPIHNTCWTPDSSMFCVIYGYMPAKTSLFNNKSEIMFEFGEGSRNIICFNSFGNLVSLAGFGNLRGGVQVWDFKQKQLISEFNAPDTTHMDWSPDGKHILTATTAPRLRVGNGFRIWTYNGVKQYENIFDTNTELYDIVWQPSNQFSEPQIVIPKGQSVSKPVEPKKYIPPHLRKDTKQSNNNNNNNSQKPQSKAIPLNENEKKIKNLEKKLQQIKDLKEQIDSGKTLEKNQMEKISKEQDLINELMQL
ncbi:eukaryotic translation initiation factor 2A-like, partial [Oppia nitens]|uniref:eukaryotic translation initiation factor 2A-like n=1 Tax=Oppia nitens TaxID=1686743 RepID=UPI0023DB51B0